MSVEWPQKETKCFLGAVIRKQEGGHNLTESVLREVLGKRKFTLHATRRTRHGTSPLMKTVYAGFKPYVLHPSILGT